MYVNMIYKEIVRKNLNKKYSDVDLFDKGTNPYVSMILNNVIENKNTKYCARYRDCMIYDYIDEFMKRFYIREESDGRLPGIAKYYKNYIKFMCKPTLRNFRVNAMLHQYADYKAELYHCKNYEEKGRNYDKNKEKINYQTILTDSIKENINENIITRSELDCEDLEFFTESVNKENASINLDEYSLAELGFNEYLASVRSNKEESILFLLGKFEDRKINEKFCKNNILTSTQTMSNYDRTTTDYSMKTVKENTATDVKNENKKSHLGNLNVKEADHDLKMKLTNIIQDINSKTRNRNICNHVSTVSLIKDNSVNTIHNKFQLVRGSLTNTHTEKKIPNTKTNLSNSKFNTFHSKNKSNPSEMISNLKKISVSAIKKLKKLDFKIMNTGDTAVIFKSQKENPIAQYDVNNVRNDNKLHKTFQLKFSQNEKKNSDKLLNKEKPSTNIERIKSPKFINVNNSNHKLNAVNFDSKILKDNNLLLTSRIQNLQKDNPKSRNINPVLNQDRSSINKSNDNFKTEMKGVAGLANHYTKSFKINLDIPSKCDDLRSRIYGSYDSTKYLNNFITDSNKNLFKQLSISRNNKSPINQPQILIKNKAHQNLLENTKKSDSTCDKSNYLTYNSIKSKEIFSTISFQKNSEEAANLKKEKVTPAWASNTKINSKEFMTKDFSKNKTNLMRAFNSCSSSTTQSKLSSSNKIKFQIKNNKK